MELQVGIGGVVEIPTLFDRSELSYVPKRAVVSIVTTFSVDLVRLAEEIGVPAERLDHDYLQKLANHDPAQFNQFVTQVAHNCTDVRLH